MQQRRGGRYLRPLASSIGTAATVDSARSYTTQTTRPPRTTYCVPASAPPLHRWQLASRLASGGFLWASNTAASSAVGARFAKRVVFRSDSAAARQRQTPRGSASAQ